MRESTVKFNALIAILGGKEVYLKKIDSAGVEAMLSCIDPPATLKLKDVAPTIFQTDGKLEELLRQAAEVESFEPTIQYMLTLLDMQNSAQQPSSKTKQPLSGLGSAFVKPYLGAAADGLFRYLVNHNKNYVGKIPGPYYSRQCSIVQSSGTGKTRTIIELAKRDVIVVYINLRLVDDYNSYPRRDAIPANILASNLECSLDEYSDRCVAFFHALFEILLSTLKRISAGKNDYRKVVEAWSKDMCDMESPARIKFFKEIQTRYDEVRLVIKSRRGGPDKAKTTGDDTQGADNSISGTIIKEPGMSSTSDVNQASNTIISSDSNDSLRGYLGAASMTSPELFGGAEMKSAYKALVEQLPELFKNRADEHSPKMVIAIDEAHKLSKIMMGQYRPSHILCRVISDFSKTCFYVSNWVMFASTTSKVADFSAPSHIHSSHRISQGGQLLPAPYILLGWDQMSEKGKDRTLEPHEVARPSHIVKYGRPLWVSLLTSLPAIDEILETAGDKLCKSAQFDPTRSMQALAVLGQLFCLDAHFGHQYAVAYQQKSVSGFLRVCVDITEDRIWQSTAYPSEPILSCAAFRLLHASPSNISNTLRCLTSEVASGLIDIGKQGELVSRLILLLAKSLCVRQPNFWALDTKPDAKQDEELLDCRPLPVLTYLEFLFGSGHLNNAMREQFKNWYINFSHWTPMIKKIEVGPRQFSPVDWMTQHWFRTTALQCCHLQPSIDKVIPMYYLAPRTKANPNRTPPARQPGRSAKHVSYVLISDRARAKSTKSSLESIILEKALGTGTGHPYIVILLDLRLREKVPEFTLLKQSKNDVSLRIYGSGVGTIAYPFLGAISDTVPMLNALLHPAETPKNANSEDELLRDQFAYGATSESRHMRW